MRGWSPFVRDDASELLSPGAREAIDRCAQVLQPREMCGNRQRFLKDPDTGKGVTRRNPESEWVISNVPHLRIIGDALWTGVQARYATIQHKWSKAPEARRFNHFRRPKYLFSGLTKCGECGAGFVVYSRDQLGCFGTRERGTCTNKLTIARQEVEQRVLRALQPELRVRRLIEAGRNIEALKELQRITGCSLAWAKLWVAHRGEPDGERRPTAPCPHCGQPLRTPLARQCRFCRRDWHSTGATGA